MSPIASSPKHALTDSQAAELVRCVRARRSWPRPPAAAFWLRLSADICFGTTLLSILLIAIPSFSRTPTATLWRLGFPLALFVAWFVLRFLARKLCSRLRQRVLHAGGLACINCHYPLPRPDTDDNTEQLCPECREPYRFADARKDWERWQPGVWFY